MRVGAQQRARRLAAHFGRRPARRKAYRRKRHRIIEIEANHVHLAVISLIRHRRQHVGGAATRGARAPSRSVQWH